MTWSAQSNPIIHFKPKFLVIPKRFYVMSDDAFSWLAKSAFAFVSAPDGISPFDIFDRMSYRVFFSRYTAFPHSIFIARSLSSPACSWTFHWTVDRHYFVTNCSPENFRTYFACPFIFRIPIYIIASFFFRSPECNVTRSWTKEMLVSLELVRVYSFSYYIIASMTFHFWSLS